MRRFLQNPPRGGGPDARLREAMRAVRASNDVQAARAAISEAIRAGLWLERSDAPWEPSLERRDRSITNMHRVAALRFMAWAGDKEALLWLKQLPLEDGHYPLRQEATRKKSRGGPAPSYYGPFPGEHVTPEERLAHQERTAQHETYWRGVVPRDAFKEIGPKVAVEIGSQLLWTASEAALLFATPLIANVQGLVTDRLTELHQLVLEPGPVPVSVLPLLWGIHTPAPIQDWSLPPEDIRSRAYAYGQEISQAILPGRSRGMHGDPATAPLAELSDGWRELLQALSRHTWHDRPEGLAGALLHTRSALAWSHGHERRKDQWGGSFSQPTRAANARANREIRAAVLGPITLATALLYVPG